MIVTDWLHNSAYDEFKKEINGSRTLPTMDSILVDGLGMLTPLLWPNRY